MTILLFGISYGQDRIYKDDEYRRMSIGSMIFPGLKKI